MTRLVTVVIKSLELCHRGDDALTTMSTKDVTFVAVMNWYSRLHAM